MKKGLLGISTTYLMLTSKAQQIYEPEELRSTIDEQTVTCSSSIRIQNLASNYFLHSMGVGYGGGSGQQIVTCHKSSSEIGGLWTLKED